MRYAPYTVEGVNQRVNDLATIVEEETTSMYGIIEDAQDDWFSYKKSESLVCIGDSLSSDVAQSALISELQSADHRRQRVISELLASDHKRQLVKYYGLFPVADCIDLFVCLATLLGNGTKWNRPTRLQPDANTNYQSQTLITTSVSPMPKFNWIRCQNGWFVQVALVNASYRTILKCSTIERSRALRSSMPQRQVCYVVPCKDMEMLSYMVWIPTLKDSSTMKCSCNAMEDTEEDDDRQILPEGQN
ncbi:hypothetical protein Tco_0178239 [Tanacetum coccineum]